MPDLLGFGRSPKPRGISYSMNDHLRALRWTLARRRVEQFHLVGHSMGSLVALALAAAHPERVRSLVLISLPIIGCLPWGHLDGGRMRRSHHFLAHTRLGSLAGSVAIRAAFPAGMILAPRVQRDVPAAAARDAMRVTAASYWRTLEQVVYGTDVEALVERLRTRALLIHGADDRTAPLEPVEDLARGNQAVHLRVIAGVGHNPIVSDPEGISALVREWQVERATLKLGSA